jgi:hypothetical protein
MMRMSRIRLASQGLRQVPGGRNLQHQLRPSWCYNYNYGQTMSSSFSTSPLRRQEEKQWSTPLAKQLFEAISVLLVL